MHTFFFLGNDEFPEVREFVVKSDAEHHLSMHTYTCGFKDGLHEMVEQRSIKAVFLGTRHGDPNCKDQDFFCPSSKGWPPFLRVNPVLNWAYSDVWAYLRSIEASYCSLYLEGYTSLGSTKNTAPNSSLRRSDGTFAPAYMLNDDRLERTGRAYTSGILRHISQGPEHAPTAAVAIIGDELLAGKVADANSPFLAARLHALGWRVPKIVIIPDSVDAIAREVGEMMAAADVVVTCGGVGPTVDDCTVEGVALAAGTRTATDKALEASLREYFGESVTESHLKMARVPEGCSELLPYSLPDGSTSPFPLLKVANVFVLPGVPKLVQAKWAPLQEQLLRHVGQDTAHFCNRLIKIKSGDEASIAPIFEAIVEEFPDVSAGSYPVSTDDGEVVMISLEAKDNSQLDGAVGRYRQLLEQQCGSDDQIVSVQRDTDKIS
eukprot:jgi/Ulvmu1/8805/UM048_0060.1